MIVQIVLISSLYTSNVNMCSKNSEVHNFFYTICERLANEIIDYKMLTPCNNYNTTFKAFMSRSKVFATLFHIISYDLCRLFLDIQCLQR